MVVLLAIRLAVPLKEVLGAQFHVAMGATEVLWVPSVTKGGDHLPDDWFAGKVCLFRWLTKIWMSFSTLMIRRGLLASKADAFLFCFYSLLVHVLLK